MLCALLAAAGSGGNWKSELLSVLALAESACAGGEAAQAKQAATANTVAKRGLCIVRFPVDVVKSAEQIHPGSSAPRVRHPTGLPRWVVVRYRSACLPRRETWYRSVRL